MHTYLGTLIHAHTEKREKKDRLEKSNIPLINDVIALFKNMYKFNRAACRDVVFDVRDFY